MEIDAFAPEESTTVLRTLRTALRTHGPLSDPELTFLKTYASLVRLEARSGEPAPIEPGDVHVEGAHRRKRLVQLSAMAALFASPVRPESARFVADLARSLEVKEPVVPVLLALAAGRRTVAKVLTFRRMLAGVLREAREREGLRGVARFLAGMFLRAAVNRDKTWHYKRLGLLPQGTLGRSFWEHMARLGYAFPGEHGGIPETMAYHDVAHVLSGYDTTPWGEIRQGCFQGGNRRKDGFFFIQFVLLQFHQGVRLTPVAQPETGYFDPVDILVAIHRGASCPVDVTHGWDYWPLMSLSLEEARARVGVSPFPSRVSRGSSVILAEAG